MKKIGLIVLMLVLTFGSLGLGYSMWSQTITLKGEVNTGAVNIAVSQYSGTWAWKDLDYATDPEADNGPNGLIFLTGPGAKGSERFPSDWTEPAAVTPLTGVNPYFTNLADDHQMIGLAEITTINGNTPNGAVQCATPGGRIAVTGAWQNLFPVPNPAGGFFDWCADFNLTNVGTIPVKIHVVSATGTGLIPAVQYSVNGVIIGNLEGYQIEPGLSVHVELCVAVDEATTQGSGGTFEIVLAAEQWNEYSAS